MATTIADFPYLWRLAGAVVLDAGAYEEIEPCVRTSAGGVRSRSLAVT